jgi:hypothetical protein
MESFFKISILLLLSLTQATKTNRYHTSLTAPREEKKIEVVVVKENSEPKEMDSFWLTRILMMES